MLLQISRNWADLVKRARAKQLAPDEFQSGTFTISNLGNFGADTFDAILPPGMRLCSHADFIQARSQVQAYAHLALSGLHRSEPAWLHVQGISARSSRQRRGSGI